MHGGMGGKELGLGLKIVRDLILTTQYSLQKTVISTLVLITYYDGDRILEVADC